jgi:hypothetical protein
MIEAARPNLRDAESREMEELLTEYRDILAKNSDDLWTDRQSVPLYTRLLANQADVGEILDNMK